MPDLEGEKLSDESDSETQLSIILAPIPTIELVVLTLEEDAI